MNREMLEDFEAKEEEKANKIVNSLKMPFSFRDFNPELKLVQPYAGRIRDVPLWVMLPYYGTLIVNLDCYESEKVFIKQYGVTVDQLLELEKSKKVAIALRRRPIHYEGLDYLDPILEKKPPTPFRSLYFTRVIVGDEDERKRLINRGTETFKGKLAEFSKKFALKNAQERCESICATRYLRLHAFGYKQLSENLLEIAKANPIEGFKKLDLYATFLTAPVYRSYEGCHPIKKSRILWTKNIGLKVTTPSEVFPIEVAKVLVERVKLVEPKNLTNALDVYPDFQKARKVLSALNDAIDRKESEEKIRDKQLILNDAFREVEEMKGQIEGGVKMITATIGVAGIIATLLTGLPGLLAGMGLAVAKPYITEPMAEQIVKFRKPSYLTVIYDFEKEVKKWKK